MEALCDGMQRDLHIKASKHSCMHDNFIISILYNYYLEFCTKATRGNYDKWFY